MVQNPRSHFDFPVARNDNPRVLADPPASSATPNQGQAETNDPNRLARENEDGRDQQTEEKLRQAAYDFGWQSYLQHGRSPSKEPVTFDAVEAELARHWLRYQESGARQPWQEAREAAREAWDQVQDAMLDGTSSKSSAR
jgi:hypothetical protein